MSAIATAEAETTGHEGEDPRQWTRNPKQQAMVDKHLADVAAMYGAADPTLREALEDPEILGAEEIAAFFGYLRLTRLYQLYSDAEDLRADDQLPHPSGIPEPDATGGHRGAREIRGIMKGRLVQWALQSGRFYWNPVQGELVRQTAINHGGAARQKRN